MTKKKKLKQKQKQKQKQKHKKQNILTIKTKKTMETKFYKWVSQFSDGIDQVVMINSGTSCRVSDFGINQKIEYYNYEVSTDDMTIATKAEFLGVYSKVSGEMLSRMLNTIL